MVNYLERAADKTVVNYTVELIPMLILLNISGHHNLFLLLDYSPQLFTVGYFFIWMILPHLMYTSIKL